MIVNWRNWRDLCALVLVALLVLWIAAPGLFLLYLVLHYGAGAPL